MRAISYIVAGLFCGVIGFFGFLGILGGAISVNLTSLGITVVSSIISPFCIDAGYCAWKLYKAGYTTKKLSDRRL